MSTPRRTMTPIRGASGSLRPRSADTPLTFLQDEALPILAEETTALQDNFAQLADIQQALATFNENFAAFLYGIKMNAFCVEWPEAPTEASLRTLSRSAPPLIEADQTYMTDAPTPPRPSPPSPAAPAPRPAPRPAQRPATSSAASGAASARRIPPAVQKKRASFADHIVDTMPLEYRQGDPKQRALLHHIIYALLESNDKGVRVADVAAKAPAWPAGKINKALIALLAANHVVRVSDRGVVYRWNTQKHPVRP